MENKRLDYDAEHYCPVYERVISPDLCYDSIMVLGRFFKIESLSELSEVANIENARTICKDCPYSDMN